MRKIFLLLSAMFLLLINTMGQDRTVTGKVTDDKGLPVANASVIVKGTKKGTATNVLGEYTLSVPANAKTLLITSVNMVAVEVSISSGIFNAVLVPDMNTMTNVIVTVPYGTVKKTAFTGSENTVTAATIQKQQVTDITHVLEGLIPGITATNGGGAPGAARADIQIRGPSSISLTSAPLYVLNGVPYFGSISALSNDDIESVTVLKDAAASALYGSRAANGVIMITTKKGKKGKANVSGSFRQGFMSRGIPEYDRVGPQQYYELFWEAYKNAYVSQGQSAAIAGHNASEVLTGPSGLVYNAYNVPGNQLVDSTGKFNPNAKLLWNESWEDALFRTASRTNANVSISGANDNMDYFISGGYLNEEGIVRNSDYKRYNLRVDLNVQATDWFKVGLNLDGASAKRDDLLATGSFTSNPFYYSRNMGPIYPVYQHDPVTGAYVDTLGEHRLDYGVPEQMGTRPYAGRSNLRGTLDLDKNYSDIFNGNANTYAEIKFLKDFTFKTTLGLNLFSDYATAYQNNQYGDAAPSTPGGTDGGRSTKTIHKILTLTGNEVLTWKKTFGGHNITALAGHENYKLKDNNLSANKSGFIFPGQTDLNNGATSFGPATSTEDNHRIESYLANVNYDYKAKYLLSASFRRDGSSRFSPEARWGNFYSAGIGWRLTQEKFLKNIKWLSELKLRASYGEQGNEDINLYYQYRDYYFANGTGGYNPPDPFRYANPDLKWEKNAATNIAIDLGIFKNRLTLTAEWFNKVSSNLLFDVPGASSVVPFSYKNIGTMYNRGYELQLGYSPVRSSNFNWKIDANATHFINKVTKIPGTPIYQKNGITQANGIQNVQVGHSKFEFYLPEFAGVDASNGDALYYTDVLDANGNSTGQRTITNVLNSKTTRYYHGTSLPKISGGITNSFNYKGFDLSILLTFAYGGLYYDGNYQGLMHRGDAGTAWSSDILGRWQKPGDVTNIPRLQNNISGQDGASTRWLVDGSWLNIKNITLSYTLPKTGLKNLNGLSIFVNVDNAHLFTAKKGIDPQRAFDGTSDASYTPFRTFTAGFTVNLK